jgi:hypothetical protein
VTSKKRILILGTGFIVTSLALTQILYKNKKEHLEPFSIQAITCSFPSDERWAISSDCQLQPILNQPFTYLSSGGQSYAFLSEDGKYVLKFLKQDKFSKRLFGNKRRERKRERDFSSYKLAYDHLKEETGLLFLHLVPHDNFPWSVTVVDSSQKNHHIELQNYAFYLQKYANPLLSQISNAMKQNKEEEAKRTLDALFAMMQKRIRLGIADRDPAIAGNFGMIDNQAIQIDIGRFFKLSRQGQFAIEQKEFIKKNSVFCAWLEEHYPTLLPHYQELEKQYQRALLN